MKAEAINDMKNNVIRLMNENERLKKWIIEAGRMLSAAGCVIVDNCPEQLSKVAGIRGIIELCPVDFTANADVLARGESATPTNPEPQ